MGGYVFILFRSINVLWRLHFEIVIDENNWRAPLDIEIETMISNFPVRIAPTHSLQQLAKYTATIKLIIKHNNVNMLFFAYYLLRTLQICKYNVNEKCSPIINSVKNMNFSNVHNKILLSM